IFLLGIARQVGQGQNRQGTNEVSTPLDLRNEAITTARDGLDKTRRLCRVAERFPEPLDSVVDAVIEIDERIGGPDLGTQLFSRHDLAGTLSEKLQNLEGLVLK